MPANENESRGEDEAKPPSVIVSIETEESRCVGVLRESRSVCLYLLVIEILLKY